MAEIHDQVDAALDIMNAASQKALNEIDRLDTENKSLVADNKRLAEELKQCRESNTPVPPKVVTLMGQSTDRNPSQASIDADEVILGDCQIGRIFFGDRAMLWDQMGALKTLPFISSVKFYLRNLSKAQIRSEVFRFLDAAPVDGNLKVVMDDHEKDLKVERKTYSLQEGVDTTNYMNSLIKEHGHPDARTTLLLTGFKPAERYPQWAGVDRNLLDIFSFDFYRGQKADENLAQAEKHFAGKPLVVGEFGAGIIGGARGTDAERAAFIKSEGSKLAASPKVLAMAYFAYSDHHMIKPTENLSRQAWADVRAIAAAK